MARIKLSRKDGLEYNFTEAEGMFAVFAAIALLLMILFLLVLMGK